MSVSWVNSAIVLLAFIVFVLAWRWWQRRASAASISAENEQAVPLPDSQTIQENEALDRGISSLPDALVLLSEQWQLKWANDTASSWLGISMAEDINKPIWQVIDISGFKDYLSSQDFADSFDCAAPIDEGVQLAIRVVPYQEKQFLLQVREITKMKQLEQIRRDFVANASHELRTPLSIIYGYLEMMQDEPDESISAQWKPAINQMYTQTERIKQIIDDMLLLSRLDDVNAELDHQFVSMTTLMETACKDAEVLSVHKGHQIIKQVEQHYSLLCDGEEIRSLVMNLITNAVRYTPDNGSITIGWCVDMAGAKLSVNDTGIGIEQQDIPRLTERFYRTDPARSRAAGGTGIGLAIVNHIVNRHQAKLVIQSVMGEGSEFAVHFPNDMVRADHEQVNLLLN